jgi:hypothetical protein
MGSIVQIIGNINRRTRRQLRSGGPTIIEGLSGIVDEEFSGEASDGARSYRASSKKVF